MASELRPFSLKLPSETIQRIEEIRDRLQAEQPGMLVSRADAVRAAIHSLSADFRMRPLLAETAKDSEKRTGRKGRDKRG